MKLKKKKIVKKPELPLIYPKIKNILSIYQFILINNLPKIALTLNLVNNNCGVHNVNEL